MISWMMHFNFFQERHFDGVEKTYLKYKLTQTDIDRGKGTAGITTTTVSDGGIDYDYEEDSRYFTSLPME